MVAEVQLPVLHSLAAPEGMAWLGMRTAWDRQFMCMHGCQEIRGQDRRTHLRYVPAQQQQQQQQLEIARM